MGSCGSPESNIVTVSVTTWNGAAGGARGKACATERHGGAGAGGEGEVHVARQLAHRAEATDVRRASGVRHTTGGRTGRSRGGGGSLAAATQEYPNPARTHRMFISPPHTPSDQRITPRARPLYSPRPPRWTLHHERLSTHAGRAGGGARHGESEYAVQPYLLVSPRGGSPRVERRERTSWG